MSEIRTLAMPEEFDMVYRIAGPENGAPLLILHGLGSNHIQFEDDVAYFSRTRRVIQPDMRGHGDTGAPPGADVKDFTCRKFAEDVSFLLDSLGVTYLDVVGNSLGGDIALELIDLRPALVRSLTTFGTTYQLDVPRYVLIIRDVIYFFLGKRLAKYAAEKTSGTPHGREILTRTFSEMQPRTSKLVGPNICKFDYRSIAEAFDGRILLLQCEGDNGINAVLKPTLDTLSRLSYAEVVQFETGGHCANVDDPHRFHACLDEFLASVEECGAERFPPDYSERDSIPLNKSRVISDTTSSADNLPPGL